MSSSQTQVPTRYGQSKGADYCSRRLCICILLIVLFLPSIIQTQESHLEMAYIASVPSLDYKNQKIPQKHFESQRKQDKQRKDILLKEFEGIQQNLWTAAEALVPLTKQAYGILLEPKPGRSFNDGKQLFMEGDYWLASEIIMENRYTAQAVRDPYYLNWLLKSLLAARRLELIPRYLKQYRLQLELLRKSTDKRDAELYYLIGRYYFARGDMRLSRKIFADYLHQFQSSNYIPSSYYWIARSLERDNYLEQARTVYLLVVSYYSRHYLNNMAKYKASIISLYLLKQQAEEFLRSRGVDWTL